MRELFDISTEDDVAKFYQSLSPESQKDIAEFAKKLLKLSDDDLLKLLNFLNSEQTGKDDVNSVQQCSQG